MHTCVLTSHAGMTTSPSSTDSFFEIQVTYRDGFPGRLPGKSEYLDRLNRDYFKESSRRSRSKNMIQVVLWFRIDLTRGKAAQLVTLRPNLVRDQIEVERWDIDATETVWPHSIPFHNKLYAYTLHWFRDPDGNPDRSRDGGLRLSLADFIPETPVGSSTPKEELRHPIVISTKRLCWLLHQAESEVDKVANRGK